jgi:hypothetical protein
LFSYRFELGLHISVRKQIPPKFHIKAAIHGRLVYSRPVHLRFLMRPLSIALFNHIGRSIRLRRGFSQFIVRFSPKRLLSRFAYT